MTFIPPFGDFFLYKKRQGNPMSLFLFLFHVYSHHIQFLGINHARCTHHHILRTSRLGEGVDFTDIGLIDQNHQKSIKPNCKSTVGRWSILKRLIHRPKPFFDFVHAISRRFKGFDQNFWIVITDRSWQNLIAITRQIVLGGFSFSGVGRVHDVQSALNIRKRIVCKIKAVGFVLVFFKKRKIQNPNKAKMIGIDEIVLISQGKTELIHARTDSRLLASHHKHDISYRTAKFVSEHFFLLVRKFGRKRSTDSCLVPLDIAKSRSAVAFDQVSKGINIFSRDWLPTEFESDNVAVSVQGLCKEGEIRLCKQCIERMQFAAKTQVRFVRAIASHRLIIAQTHKIHGNCFVWGHL